MTQRQLERAIAQATGESIGTIRRHGFSVVEVLSGSVFAPTAPQVVDWDALDEQRTGLWPARSRGERSTRITDGAYL